MTRYFYAAPLTAAWMEAHYDIDFTDAQGRPVVVNICTGEFETNSPLYIHPDSLHLLEPQKGDLLHIVRGFCSYYKIVADIATGGGKTTTGIWSGGEHWDITTKEPLHDWEIIQRNGIPFHWPEKENENGH